MPCHHLTMIAATLEIEAGVVEYGVDTEAGVGAEAEELALYSQRPMRLGVQKDLSHARLSHFHRSPMKPWRRGRQKATCIPAPTPTPLPDQI
jgi:hypothetical protein